VKKSPRKRARHRIEVGRRHGYEWRMALSASTADKHVEGTAA
jgi:hypothetical protein